MLHTTPTVIARRHDTAVPLAVATPTTRKLADASISVNTRRAYLGALARLDAWRGTAPVDDASLAVYLGTIYEAGRAPATAALAVAAVRFRAKLAGQPDPAGEATARVSGGYRRTAADRGRGQAAPLSADGLAAILATAERPRTDGRGVESHTTAQRRGRTDAVIAGLLFMGGLRRAEVSALEWRDVSDTSDGDGVLIAVRQSKTNQEGDTADVRFLKNGAAAAVRTLRTDRPDAAPTDRVIGLSPLQIQRRSPRRRHRGALDGAQWPGWARVRRASTPRHSGINASNEQATNRQRTRRKTMMVRTVLVDPTRAVQEAHLEQIADGTVAVVSKADFPTKNGKYPADITSRLTEDHEKHCPDICGGLEQPRTEPDKGQKPNDVSEDPAVNEVLRRVLKKR